MVPVDESDVWGPPAKAWAVPVESVAVCGPPLPDCGESVTTGEIAAEMSPERLVGASNEAPGVAGWPAWTVPVDESAVCEPPENACTVPLESDAVCEPPLPDCGETVAVGKAAADVDPLEALVGAPALTPGVAGWPTWTVPVDESAVWVVPPPPCVGVTVAVGAV